MSRRNNEKAMVLTKANGDVSIKCAEVSLGREGANGTVAQAFDSVAEALSALTGKR
jgi:hypothetical protein